MASNRVAQILRAKSDFSETQIQAISDKDAWAWLYQHFPPKRSQDNPAQICFTGFSQETRAELEAIARSAKLEVVHSVTKHLQYLCAGPNAGPAKQAKAQAQGVIVLTVEAFRRLLETGEIPD